MERLIMLGTGCTEAEICYHSCFAIQKGREYLLVDGGGGSRILTRLKEAQIPLTGIHHIFASCEREDHLLGLVWVIKEIAKLIRDEVFEGELRIYCRPDLADTLRTVCSMVLPKKLTWLFDHRIVFVSVYDGDSRQMMGYETTFFDLHTVRSRQFGFAMTMGNGARLVFAGSEPLNEQCFDYAAGADLLIHEAYCLYSQQETFRAYEKNLGTVRDACELANYLQIPNLLLYSTEEVNLKRRAELYQAEGRLYYKGNIIVPRDLESIEFDDALQDEADSDARAAGEADGSLMDTLKGLEHLLDAADTLGMGSKDDD